MEAQLIMNKIEFLPDNVKQQVVDYIDFLTDRYLAIINKGLKNENEFVLTNEIREVLDHSIAHHEAYPHKAKTADEVFKNIAKKYN